MTGQRIITLTTDFGVSSPYVAQMKAAILSVCGDVRLVDVCHAIAPQNIRQGALVLDDVTPAFPAGTIHLGVVDPGVGTSRPIVYAQMGTQRYIAPDNGLLSLLARRQPCSQLVALRTESYWRHPVSPTFHGRDVMAPVAAHLCLGVRPDQLGPRHAELLDLNWPEVKTGPSSLNGHLLCVDSFGNLVTNIERGMLPADLRLDQLAVQCQRAHGVAVVETYGQAAVGQLVALIGSSNRLEIAVNQGNAAVLLGADVGDEVRVTWSAPDSGPQDKCV